MTDEQMVQQIRELRGRGLSPKEIARSLQVRPAVVSGVIRGVALERNATGNNMEHFDCLLNYGWSTGLTIDGHPDWNDPGRDEAVGGLITAVVTRRRSHRHGGTVCVYLLDVYCLGVKNVMGPDTMNEQELSRLTSHAFSGYETPPVSAPIELVRDLVFGSVDYARGLGFAPHHDFGQAREHLGAWSGPSAVTFGYEGKPTYLAGPYDDSDHIFKTLSRTVGSGGFDFTTGVDVDDLP